MPFTPKTLTALGSQVARRPAGPVASDPDIAAWMEKVEATGATLSQDAVDLFDAFAASLKGFYFSGYPSCWELLACLGVFLGPSTLDGAMIPILPASGAGGTLTPVSFVPEDYSPTFGLTGGAGKYISLGATLSGLGTTDQAWIGFYDSNDNPSKATRSARIANGTASANWRLLIQESTSTGLASKVSWTTDLVSTANKTTAGLIQAANLNGSGVMRVVGVENSATRPTSGAASTIYLFGSATTNSFLGTGAGYFFGMSALSDTASYMAHMEEAWDTLINGLKAL